MANTTTTPNMNLPVPVPGTDPGPDWANNIVADMTAIDSHNHTSGQGVQIPPSGLNINSDLPFNGNNATTVKSVRFTPQSANLAAGADIGCLYEVTNDLWYNDGAGNQVRITQGGSVTGSTGTITGLPSGTASAAFSGGTFTFQSATNTPATMAVGPLVIGAAVALSKTVTIGPPPALAASYSLQLPGGLPTSGGSEFLAIGPTGSMGTTPTSGAGGSVVLSNTPTIASPTMSNPTLSNATFSGTPAGTITSGTYSPTITPTSGTGGTASGFRYIRTGDQVMVFGQIVGTTNASGVYTATITLPINPGSTFSLSSQATGLVGSGALAFSQNSVRAQTGSNTVIMAVVLTITTNVSNTFFLSFAYSCA